MWVCALCVGVRCVFVFLLCTNLPLHPRKIYKHKCARTHTFDGFALCCVEASKTHQRRHLLLLYVYVYVSVSVSVSVYKSVYVYV